MFQVAISRFSPASFAGVESMLEPVLRLARMVGWPQITEPLLRERQGMSNEQFFKLLAELLEAVGTRELDDEHYERAIGYPWERRPGSCLVTDKGVEDLVDIDADDRNELVHKYVYESAERVPLLTYGANASPERLSLKLAHLPESDHEALIIAGDLEGFDVGAAAHPPVWSSMPATLIPSPGTKVRVAVLFLTPAQFTALWWTELSYLVGALTGIVLVTDVVKEPIDHVILFISRFGAFCVDGDPVAMAAIPAKNRRPAALTQTEILDAAARMAIGERASARDLVKASFENPAAFMADRYESFQAASAPFESEHWTEMPVDAG
jgi:hypothetical protein